MFPSVLSILGKCLGMTGENGDVIVTATMTGIVIITTAATELAIQSDCV
jgi:hypothetical protein